MFRKQVNDSVCKRLGACGINIALKEDDLGEQFPRPDDLDDRFFPIGRGFKYTYITACKQIEGMPVLAFTEDYVVFMKRFPDTYRRDSLFALGRNAFEKFGLFEQKFNIHVVSPF